MENKHNEFISAGDSGRTLGDSVYVCACMHVHTSSCCVTLLMTPVPLLRTPVLMAMQTCHFHKKVSFDCEEDPSRQHMFSSSKVGGVDPKQLAVYEEFARNVPGFLPTNDLSQPTGFLAQPMKVNTCLGLQFNMNVIVP